ncbi:esterase [Kocuria soli]|uniref:Esterase n=1 Tax=Kocuria soli TaxID=2485125 RepID=A0A3N3ZR60_9MICC|nr:glycerophosphodiester phosphodiesterase family protein [Kocuria soli]ROZ62842.1 esterase [Kocuria soli]
MKLSPGNAPADMVLAHRGFAPDGAENTLTAFRAARDLGCRWIETDVHTTKDGVVLAFHDATLDRVTQGAGQINDLNHAELADLMVAGTSPVPTLREVLDELPELYVNIDVKDEASVTALPAVLEATGAAGRVRIASFSDSRRGRTLAELSARGLRPLSTSVGATGFLTALVLFHTVPAAWPAARWLSRRRVPKFDVIQMPMKLGWMLPKVRSLPLVGEWLGRRVVATRRFVAAAHRHGIQVHVWTVNRPEDMELILHHGVDALVTDRADLALEVVAGLLRERTTTGSTL